MFTFISEGVERLFGYSVDEFYCDSELWHKVILEEDKKDINFDPVTNYISPGRWIYRVKRKDGKIRWVSNEKLMRTDTYGNEYFFGIIRDITESYLQEKEMEKLRNAVDVADVVVWTADINNQKNNNVEMIPLTFICDNIERLSNIKKSDFIKGSPEWLNYVYKEDLKIAKEYRKSQVYPKNVCFRVIPAGEKEVKWVNVKTVIKNGIKYGVGRDITDIVNNTSQILNRK